MEGITTLFFIVKKLLLLPLLLGFSVPAIAYNEANGGYFCGCPEYDNDCVDANGESLILVIQ